MSLPNCPKCGSEYVYEDGHMLVCPECFYEWAENGEEKLVELGLAPERIVKTIGEGSKKPVASNDTEEGRAMNRRIELEFFAQK